MTYKGRQYGEKDEHKLMKAIIAQMKSYNNASQTPVWIALNLIVRFNTYGVVHAYGHQKVTPLISS
jgi:hypothetical protein